MTAGLVLAVAGTAALTSCSGRDGAAAAAVERFAFFPADNQTGDANLEWIAHLLPRALWAATGAGTGQASVADARVTSANRYVYSTLRRQAPGAGSALQLHAEVFDPATSRLVREYTVLAADGSAKSLYQALAAKFTPHPYSLGASDDASLETWNAITAEKDCQQLAASRPSFAPAIAACLELLLPAQRLDAVKSMIAAAGDQPLTGYAPGVQFIYGQAYMSLRDFPRAANAFALAAPSSPASRNMEGYAEALIGKCAEARKTLESYAQVPGEEANGLDSLGETAFFCGQWKEAEGYFTASAPKWPAPRSDLEPLKAAAARLMSGDAAGADQLVAAHRDKLAKAKSGLLPQIDAIWNPIRSAPTPAERAKRIDATLIHRP